MTTETSADVPAQAPTNDEEKLEKQRKYRNEYFKKRYHSDPEFKQRLIGHIKASRAKKKDEYNAKQKEWRDGKGEEHKEYMRQWRIRNKERIREYKKEWHKKQQAKKENEKASKN